jgi:hypothetical protein
LKSRGALLGFLCKKLTFVHTASVHDPGLLKTGVR